MTQIHFPKVQGDMGSTEEVDMTPLVANAEELEEQKGGHTVYRRNNVRTLNYFEVNFKTVFFSNLLAFNVPEKFSICDFEI